MFSLWFFNEKGLFNAQTDCLSLRKIPQLKHLKRISVLHFGCICPHKWISFPSLDAGQFRWWRPSCRLPKIWGTWTSRFALAGPLQPIIYFVQDVDFDLSGAQGACRCGERGARRVVGGQATEVTIYLNPSQSISIHLLNKSYDHVAIHSLFCIARWTSIHGWRY